MKIFPGTRSLDWVALKLRCRKVKSKSQHALFSPDNIPNPFRRLLNLQITGKRFSERAVIHLKQLFVDQIVHWRFRTKSRRAGPWANSFSEAVQNICYYLYWAFISRRSRGPCRRWLNFRIFRRVKSQKMTPSKLACQTEPKQKILKCYKRGCWSAIDFPTAEILDRNPASSFGLAAPVKMTSITECQFQDHKWRASNESAEARAPWSRPGACAPREIDYSREINTPEWPWQTLRPPGPDPPWSSLNAVYFLPG